MSGKINALMNDLGYRFNDDMLRMEFTELIGHEPSPESVKWFKAISPYLVIAYQKGLKHESLRGPFPFLEKMEAAV